MSRLIQKHLFYALLIPLILFTSCTSTSLPKPRGSTSASLPVGALPRTLGRGDSGWSLRLPKVHYSLKSGSPAKADLTPASASDSSYGSNDPTASIMFSKPDTSSPKINPSQKGKVVVEQQSGTAETARTPSNNRFVSPVESSTTTASSVIKDDGRSFFSNARRESEDTLCSEVDQLVDQADKDTVNVPFELSMEDSVEELGTDSTVTKVDSGSSKVVSEAEEEEVVVEPEDIVQEAKSANFPSSIPISSSYLGENTAQKLEYKDCKSFKDVYKRSFIQPSYADFKSRKGIDPVTANRHSMSRSIVPTFRPKHELMSSGQQRPEYSRPAKIEYFHCEIPRAETILEEPEEEEEPQEEEQQQQESRIVESPVVANEAENEKDTLDVVPVEEATALEENEVTVESEPVKKKKPATKKRSKKTKKEKKPVEVKKDYDSDSVRTSDLSFSGPWDYYGEDLRDMFGYWPKAKPKPPPKRHRRKSLINRSSPPESPNPFVKMKAPSKEQRGKRNTHFPLIVLPPETSDSESEYDSDEDSSMGEKKKKKSPVYKTRSLVDLRKIDLNSDKSIAAQLENPIAPKSNRRKSVSDKQDSDKVRLFEEFPGMFFANDDNSDEYETETDESFISKLSLNTDQSAGEGEDDKIADANSENVEGNDLEERLDEEAEDEDKGYEGESEAEQTERERIFRINKNHRLNNPEHLEVLETSNWPVKMLPKIMFERKELPEDQAGILSDPTDQELPLVKVANGDPSVPRRLSPNVSSDRRYVNRMGIYLLRKKTDPVVINMMLKSKVCNELRTTTPKLREVSLWRRILHSTKKLWSADDGEEDQVVQDIQEQKGLEATCTEESQHDAEKEIILETHNRASNQDQIEKDSVTECEDPSQLTAESSETIGTEGEQQLRMQDQDQANLPIDEKEVTQLDKKTKRKLEKAARALKKKIAANELKQAEKLEMQRELEEMKNQQRRKRKKLRK